MSRYAFDDAGGTYQAGKGIAATRQAADTAGNAFLSALLAVSTGDSTVDAAVRDLHSSSVGPARQLGVDVQNLGTNTANGAKAGVQTQNDFCTLQNGAGGLALRVNAGGKAPIMA